MSITKEQILETISKMSIMDVTELVSMMEKKFGVSAATSVSVDSTNKSEVVEEKTEFDVILNAIGTSKIAVIKAIRSTSNLGLKEAKDLVESAPVTVKENINKDDANKLKKILEEAGASVEVR